MLTSTELSVW